MLGWAVGWVWWFTWRLVVSGLCLWTIQNAVHQEGYYIETRTLIISGLCVILGVRIWMPFSKEAKPREIQNDD